MWLGAAVILAGVLTVVLRDSADKPMVIRSDKFVLPDVTPVPAQTETPVRYDVPLDDDLQDYITELCGQYGIRPELVYGIIKTESDYDANLIGDNGKSFGLMQIYASQHTDRCIRLGAWNLLDPRANVRVGIDYLAELMACGHGIEWALSWYNGHGGEPCEYAYRVITDAERLLESVQIVTA